MDPRDPSLRSTPGLIARIEKLRNELLKRFDSIVGGASIERQDRNTTATAQLQMQIDTAALVKAAEDLQTLIRQLQELWLFGSLDTLGQTTTEQKADEMASDVGQLLLQLVERQQPPKMGVEVSANGHEEKGEIGAGEE